MNCSSSAPTARLDAPMVMQVGALERGYTTSLPQTKYAYPVIEARKQEVKLSAARACCRGCRTSAHQGKSVVVQCSNEANKLVQCLHVLRNCQEGANCLNMLKVILIPLVLMV